ncbi:hypothetical protein PISMIDRAFT_682508 [Pisolithus microcarpus 441]|uniref:Uncharacterized protein n=1 Tax=Pisolithus microcarpus 441 TaxID=765257 RepID=A0A0C9ZCP9_9AGAM|nr:hypothetical protein PISMIDRAFT_682508 [Pisolithus microcarpus 441]
MSKESIYGTELASVHMCWFLARKSGLLQRPHSWPFLHGFPVTWLVLIMEGQVSNVEYTKSSKP